MNTSLKQLTRTMKALSDPGRIKVLKMLQEGELCVCEIQAALGLAQPTVSKHLRILEEAGLIRGRKQGVWIYYSLETEGPPCSAALLFLLRDWLEDDPVVRSTVTSLPSIRRKLCTSKG
jgi:ArsR family transcriptional regulator, arsenate/arsenite/antimonite-responsive transcriptional repressor